MGNNRRPGDTTRRGYGWQHQQLRKQWAARVATGGVCCARCGEPIQPGTQWDLGHVDGTGKRKYQGPEHARCNRSAGSAARRAKDPDPVRRTQW